VTDKDEEILAELLLRWEELRERGQDTPAAELCQEHPHLAEELARRIKALKAVSWMDKPLDPGDDGPDSEGSSDAKPRTLIGRYRLDDLIATGGFAQVWRGYDLELQRVVAVKVPRPSRLQSADAFMAEARRVARLKHPGIVPVFDVGHDGDSCFIVSEFVEGGSLGDQLSRNPPTQQQAVRWVAEIADALEYAHLHGVVHRDIKPANILIDHHGRALLADFGIAQSANKAGQEALSLGTLRYMSPEQLEGREVDARSDIFSLGVVLHEVLTGKLPYSSVEPNILRREIVAGAKVENLPADLKRICEKALHRQPHQRHMSAAHFAAELRKCLESPSSKSTGKLWAVALVFLAVAVGAFIWWQAQRPANVPQVAGETPQVKPSTTEDFDAWLKRVEGLPAKDQVDAVRTKLQTLNPGFNGEMETQTKKGVVVYARIVGANDLIDISPLAALTGLETVGFNACHNLEDISPLKGFTSLTSVELFQTKVSDLTPLEGNPLSSLVCSYGLVMDLTPLKGMPLTHLNISRSQIADIGPLKRMRLTHLDCHASQITDFSILKEMPLEVLDVSYNKLSDLSMLAGVKLRELNFHDTQVTSLSPLKGLPLTALYCYGTAVTDLSPLQGTKLTLLWCHNTKVSDLSVLKDMPLKSLVCDFDPNRDTDLIHSITTLETINGKNIADFWKVIERTPTARFVAETILREGGRVIIDERSDSLSRFDQLLAKGTISISAIDFPRSPINQEVLRRLRELPTFNCLDVSGTNFSDADFEHFQGQPLLTILRLNSTKVTGEGLSHLAGFDRLDALQLSGAPVTDDGLARLPLLPEMTQLDLSFTQITDDGLRRWAKPKRLLGLSLRGLVGVTDDGIDTLSELKELASLNLVGTSVTAAGVEKLQKMLPNCKIDR